MTCILLDGLEVDVLEVLVHLEQRTAATHAECDSPHSGAVGRSRHSPIQPRLAAIGGGGKLYALTVQ